MTPEPGKHEVELFHRMLEKAPEERAAFIEEQAADDPALADRLSRLLAAHVQADDSSGGALDVLEPRSLDPTPERIGPYRVLERIGAGGMGVVYSAEQSVPIRRRVAVKVIKLGMDTKEVIARFEAERQALAMLDHPGVARVFDAGSTTDGRPYFVMELVHGLPLNEYCSKHRLSLRDRLQLFEQVCDAVQHAHQKGIIHRDLKPSNLLVAVPEGRPVPKVIDFGVAKATATRLSEQTIFTEQGRLIGTPEYMSPEQAEMSGLDIDVRADVYSLGVVLYELLTGLLPFDSRELRAGGYSEIQRIIREVEPPRPSARLLAAPGNVAPFGHDRVAAAKMIRGDLDWIVMRAIEKDRTRRYESPRAMHDDIERHLADRPVKAGPPSAGYKLRKFVRRNRFITLVMASAVLITAAGITGLAIGLVNTREARALADRRADNALEAAAFLEKVLFRVDPEFGGGKMSLLEVIQFASRTVEEDLSDNPEVEASVRESIGVAYRRLSKFEAAEPHLLRSLEIRREALGDEDMQTAGSFVAWAYLLFEYRGETEEPLRWLEKASAAYAANDLDDTWLEAWLLLDIGIVNLAADRLHAAERAFRKSERLLTSHRNADHPDVSRPLRGLAMLALRRDQLAEAERLARRAVTNCEGEGAEYIGARAKLVLARVLLEKGSLVEAERLLEEADEQFARTVGEEHVRMAEVMACRVELLLREENDVGAVETAYNCLLVRSRILHAEHPDLLETRMLHQRALVGLDEAPEADEALLAIAEEAVQRVGANHPLTIAVAEARFECAVALGDEALQSVRADRLARLRRDRERRLEAEAKAPPASGKRRGD